MKIITGFEEALKKKRLVEKIDSGENLSTEEMLLVSDFNDYYLTGDNLKKLYESYNKAIKDRRLAVDKLFELKESREEVIKTYDDLYNKYEKVYDRHVELFKENNDFSVELKQMEEDFEIMESQNITLKEKLKNKDSLIKNQEEEIKLLKSLLGDKLSAI